MANRVSNVVNRWETTSTAEMGSSAFSVSVASTSGLTSPAYLVIEEEVPGRYEVVYFDGSWTGSSLTTTTIANRYLPGSAVGAGIIHPSGSTVRQVPVSQVITDLNDRISQHSHSGIGVNGTQIAHSALSGLTDDTHPSYLPLTGVRPMTGDLDMDTHDITNAGAIDAASLDVAGVDPTAHGLRHTTALDRLTAGVTSPATSWMNNNVNFIGRQSGLVNLDPPGLYRVYIWWTADIELTEAGSTRYRVRFALNGDEQDIWGKRLSAIGANNMCVAASYLFTNDGGNLTVALQDARDDGSGGISTNIDVNTALLSVFCLRIS